MLCHVFSSHLIITLTSVRWHAMNCQAIGIDTSLMLDYSSHRQRTCLCWVACNVLSSNRYTSVRWHASRTAAAALSSDVSDVTPAGDADVIWVESLVEAGLWRLAALAPLVLPFCDLFALLLIAVTASTHLFPLLLPPAFLLLLTQEPTAGLTASALLVIVHETIDDFRDRVTLEVGTWDVSMQSEDVIIRLNAETRNVVGWTYTGRQGHSWRKTARAALLRQKEDSGGTGFWFSSRTFIYRLRTYALVCLVTHRQFFYHQTHVPLDHFRKDTPRRCETSRSTTCSVGLRTFPPLWRRGQRAERPGTAEIPYTKTRRLTVKNDINIDSLFTLWQT